MRRLILGMTLLFMAVSAIVQAESFAPKADISEAMLQPTHPAALDAMMLQNSKVPSKEEVEIPPYPGAKVLLAQQPSGVKVNGKEVAANHLVTLGSVDSVDQVLAFYQDRVPEWSYKEEWGTHILYEGTGGFGLMEPSSMTTPHVQIRKALPKENPLMREMKTSIAIYYQP